MKLDYPQPEGTKSTPDGIMWVNERWTFWIKERPFDNPQGLAAWVRDEIERLDGFDPRVNGWLDVRLDQRAEYQALLADTVYCFKDAQVGLNDAYFKAGLDLFSYLAVGLDGRSGRE